MAVTDGLHGLLVAAVVDASAYVGAGALLLALFGYLFKELRRKDEGVWAMLADRDRRINELGVEVRFWRAKALGVAEEELVALLNEEGIPTTPNGIPTGAPIPPAKPRRRRP